MIDWNIQSRAHACQGCGKSFTDKQPYHTLLYDQKQAYARLDVCDSCWTARTAETPGLEGALISHWQGVFTVPPPRPPDPIQKQTAETLLRQLVELRDPKYVAASFILAVMLERKRLLRVKAQDRRDGRRILVYEDPRTGDLFTVPDPELHLDQLAQVQHDVTHLLQHGLPQPGQPPAPANGEPPPPIEPGSAALTAGAGEPVQASVEPAPSAPA